jgi:hypothetical protein
MSDPTRPPSQPVSESPYVIGNPGWRDGLVGAHAVFELDGFLPWEGLLANTNGALNKVELPGARVTRHGGPHPADANIQRVLFTLLGMIAMSSGHVEVEMKRILLNARQDPDAAFEDVDLTWSTLESDLAKVASGNGEIAEKLRPVLAWANENRVRQRRNDAIHSAWSHFDVGHFEGTRLPRRGAATTILDDGQGLAETATLIREYLNRLQTIVNWPILVLPPLPDDIPTRHLEVQVDPIL